MHALDNVIWSALATEQAHLGERRSSAGKFHPDVSLLGGLEEATTAAHASLASLLPVGDRVGLFMSDAVPSEHFSIVSSVPLLQMLRGDAAVPPKPEGIEPLSMADVPAMLALTELTKPGPFNRRTREMGDYFGIRAAGQLIAMAGERLRVPGYTEISAICTHPEHLGRGHAAALITALVGRITARGERPFLHVRPENRAVSLYERLGFEPRLRSRYVVLQRVSIERA